MLLGKYKTLFLLCTKSKKYSKNTICSMVIRFFDRVGINNKNLQALRSESLQVYLCALATVQSDEVSEEQ